MMNLLGMIQKCPKTELCGWLYNCKFNKNQLLAQLAHGVLWQVNDTSIKLLKKLKRWSTFVDSKAVGSRAVKACD